MISILRSGIYMGIVDLGRYGYRKYGVPTSGAMDVHSATVANVLLSNQPNDALLEIYMPGHRLLFTKTTRIVLTGAYAKIDIDDRAIHINQIYTIAAGSILSIGKFHKGTYLYLAIDGGIQSKEILGSRSHLPSVSPRRLRTGDTITIPTFQQNQIVTNVKISPIEIDSNQVILVRPGPEWHLLTPADQNIIINTPYEISNQSNRMGFRLHGEAIKNSYEGILSSGVMPGTVQLLPNGIPLILMRDCQTTGGYLRILQIHADSLNQVAQRAPRQSLKFKLG